MALKTIDAKTLKTWLDNNEAVLVDVRESAEHAAENITGATLLPLGGVSKSALPPLFGDSPPWSESLIPLFSLKIAT